MNYLTYVRQYYAKKFDATRNEVDILSSLPNSKKFKKNLSKDEVLIYATE